MKKKFLLINAIIALILIVAFSGISVVCASELNEVYTYVDETSKSTFTIIDQSNYNGTTINLETNESLDYSGTYIKQGNRITFYLNGDVLLDSEISADNTLREFVENDNNIINEILNLDKISDYVYNITEYVIVFILGLLGTSGAAILFRKQLKNLISQILTALGHLNANKDSAEESVKEVTNSAKNTIKSLGNLKEEVISVNKKEFDNLHKSINVLSKAVVIMACGNKELIANGCSEKIANELKELVKENNDEGEESKEIQ